MARPGSSRPDRSIAFVRHLKTSQNSSAFRDFAAKCPRIVALPQVGLGPIFPPWRGLGSILREEIPVGRTVGNLAHGCGGSVPFEPPAAGNELLKKLYVGNLAFTATEEELRELFEQHGPTASVRVITDRETGRSRGFGFVEFDDAANADKALAALDGQEMGGRRQASSTLRCS